MNARILSVVDAYDAMISPRPYRREPRTVVEAKMELQRCAGSQYDPHVVKTFLWVLEEQENQQGTLEEAKAPDTSDQLNPIIRVPIGKVCQPGTEWRQQMAEGRQQMAEGRQTVGLAAANRGLSAAPTLSRLAKARARTATTRAFYRSRQQ